MKRSCSRGSGVVELWRRELGDFHPRAFAHRCGASEGLVLRFKIHRKLNKHEGCVNTVSFNADGDILVSGSDDTNVILWNWDVGVAKLSFHSGHSDNVFQACFMPYTGDQTLVTCAADGEVRKAHILEGGKVGTSLLALHNGRAHKIAIETGSSHVFYSCGEDGLVQHIDLRTEMATKLFKCKLENGTFIPLNTIAIDPRSPNLFAIGGGDEYARVYDIRKYKWDGSTDWGHPINYYCPRHLIGIRNVGITGVAFSNQSELLISYNSELIYLFSKDQGLGPNPREETSKSTTNTNVGNVEGDHSGPKVYKGHCNQETVKGVSFFGPNCEYVASGSDCGRIFIWRKRDGTILRAMEGDKDVVNCIQSHPHDTVFASSGLENDIKIWTPNASEPAPPVKLEELNINARRTGLFRIAISEDMIAQILALHRIRSRSGDGDEYISANSDLPDLIMHFNSRYSSSQPDEDSSDI